MNGFDTLFLFQQFLLYMTEELSIIGSEAMTDTNFEYYFSLALQRIISWNTLHTFLQDTSISNEELKRLVKMLLTALEKVQKEFSETKHDVEIIRSADMNEFSIGDENTKNDNSQSNESDIFETDEEYQVEDHNQGIKNVSEILCKKKMDDLKCTNCDKTFALNIAHKKHIESDCKKESRSNMNSREAKTNELFHEKLFQCETCAKCFKEKGYSFECQFTD